MVMLAVKRPLSKVDFPVLASIKFDGVRIVATKIGGSVWLKTRSGKSVRIKSVENQLSKVLGDWMFDGELTYQTGKQIERSTISGAVNHCLEKHKNPGTDIPGSCFNVFDMVSIDDTEVRDGPFEFRHLRLKAFTSSLDTSIVKVAEQTEVCTETCANNLFSEVLEDGYEGLILRYADDLYEYTRSKRMIKMKADRECTLTVVDYKEGTGKYIGMIGSLTCKGTVNNRNVTVSVGSGLSDYDRGLDYSMFYHGNEVEIVYNDVTEDSLFLPRFGRLKGNYDV